MHLLTYSIKGNHPCPRRRPFRAWGGLAGLFAAAVCLPLTGHAETSRRPISGMLGATAPVMVAAIEVVPLTSNTPSQAGPQPGLLSDQSPQAVAPGPTVPLESPLPELPGGPNPSSGSPTASGTALTNPNGPPPSDKGTVDLGLHKKFEYHFRLSIVGSYDDNIFLNNTGKRDDFFTIIQPGLSLSLGDPEGDNYVRFDYSPGIFLFATYDNQDTVQHLLRLDAQYRFTKLTLNLSQQVQILDGADLTGLDSGGNQIAHANIDVSGRTSVNIYTTSATASYLLTEKSSLQLGLLYSNSDYDTLLSSSVLSSDFYYNYAYDPKITVGLGIGGGYVFSENPTPDQSFEQVNLRLTYVLTEKLSFIGTLGIEGRQSDGRNGTRVNPVFDLSALYVPFDGTTIGFTASRRILNSALIGGEDFASTGFSLSLRQRFLSRFTFTISGGYENENYFSVRDGFSSDREDNYYFVQAGVDVTIRSNITAGVSYQHRENFSSNNNQFFAANSSNSFDDNQFSFRISFNF